MFIGHFAAGFAAKRLAPRVSIAILILAGSLSDVLWIAFFAAGIEQVVIRPGLMVANSLDLVYFPFSHSLLMDFVWGGLFGGLYFLLRRDTRGAWIILATVVSHWLLDFIVHRPDMQLLPGLNLRLGLSLWNSRVATFFVEGTLWVAALLIFIRSTRPGSRASTVGFWIVIVLLTALWIMSLGGDPPPSLQALAVTNSIFMTILIAWAMWIDSNRKSGV